MEKPADPHDVSPLDDPDYVLGAGFNFADPKSPLAPLYLRLSGVVAVVLLACLFVLMSHLPVWHTDVWGHLRFGESMIENGRLPEREVFSGDFADQAAEYINYQWLTQGGAYWLFDLGRRLAAPTPDAQLGGGALLLTAAHAAIVVLRMLVLLLVFRRLTGSLPGGILGVILVLALSLCSHLFILRPQIVGELLFAAILLLLSRPVPSLRAVVLLPILFVAWANAHGSFPIGFVLVGLCLVGRTIDAFRDGGLGSTWRDPGVRRLVVGLAASLAAVALLNPHGPSLLLHVVKLANHPNIRHLEEWKPLPWALSMPLAMRLPGYLFAGSLALLPLLRWSTARISATQVLLLLFFGVQTILHARFFIWWCVVYPWVMTPHFYAVLDRGRLLRERNRPDLRKTMLAAAAAGVLFFWSAPGIWLTGGEAPSGLKRVTESTPVRAAEYLHAQYAARPDLPRVVFTTETSGEFLLWQLREEPPVRVFAYTHVHLLTTAHWEEFLTVKNAMPGWQEVLDRHRAAFIVIEAESHSRLARAVRESPAWVVERTSGPLLVARRADAQIADCRLQIAD